MSDTNVFCAYVYAYVHLCQQTDGYPMLPFGGGAWIPQSQGRTSNPAGPSGARPPSPLCLSAPPAHPWAPLTPPDGRQLRWPPPCVPPAARQVLSRCGPAPCWGADGRARPSGTWPNVSTAWTKTCRTENVEPIFSHLFSIIIPPPRSLSALLVWHLVSAQS